MDIEKNTTWLIILFMWFLYLGWSAYMDKEIARIKAESETEKTKLREESNRLLVESMEEVVRKKTKDSNL